MSTSIGLSHRNINPIVWSWGLAQHTYIGLWLAHILATNSYDQVKNRHSIGFYLLLTDFWTKFSPLLKILVNSNQITHLLILASNIKF
jgi:hypothetical protein